MSTAEVQSSGSINTLYSAKPTRDMPTGVDPAGARNGGFTDSLSGGSLLGAIEQVVSSTPMSRIPQGVKVRIELTSNGGRYYIYRYTDITTKRRKAIYGGPSRTLDPERIAQYEKRRKR